MFWCYNVCHSKHRLFLICVFVVCVRTAIILSENSSLLLLSPPHPLFILSSHLISSHPIFRKLLDLHQWASKRKREMERQWEKRHREGQRKVKERTERVTSKGNEDGGKRKTETDRQGRVSNYRTRSVFKAPLLSHPSWEKESQQKEGGGAEED